MTLKDFALNFMVISKNLTHAELRMLYLLITEPEVKRLSQQDFGYKILKNRRTINIGLKKLQRLGYIMVAHTCSSIVDIDRKRQKVLFIDEIPKNEVEKAKEFITKTLNAYYHIPYKKDFVVNEDFYSIILRDWKLDNRLENKKEFITSTIRESYPYCKFHFEQNSSDFISEEHYSINRRINFEIRQARESKTYHIKLDKLNEFFYDNYRIVDSEVLRVLRKDFRNLIIAKNRIIIPKLSDKH